MKSNFIHSSSGLSPGPQKTEEASRYLSAQICHNLFCILLCLGQRIWGSDCRKNFKFLASPGQVRIGREPKRVTWSRFEPDSSDQSFLSTYVPGGSDCKESACSMRDPGSVPGLGRSPGGGNGYPLQCSCLENSVDRGAWQATVHEFAESDTTEVTLHTQLNGSAGTACFMTWQPQSLGASESLAKTRTRLPHPASAAPHSCCREPPCPAQSPRLGVSRSSQTLRWPCLWL